MRALLLLALVAVANAQREYAAGVIWDFDARMEEAAEFESANLAAVRPDITYRKNKRPFHPSPTALDRS